jgi:hypothetical protein
MLSVTRQRLSLKGAVFGVISILVMTIGSASVLPAFGDPADPDCWIEDENNPGELIYICEDEDDDGGEDDDDGGGGEPSCDLGLIDEKGIHGGASRWCEGENACWANIPSLTEDEEDADTPPPSDDAVWIYKVCYTPDGEETGDSGWQWYEPAQPTPEQLAQIAYGRLDTPVFTLQFSPPGKSYVSLDTWWWAEGAGDGEIVGNAALGVVAIGVPHRIEVRPGEPGGPDVFECDWATSEPDAHTCTYSYVRASVDNPAGYGAQGRIVYKVHFEQNGVPFDVPGLTDTMFPSPWESTNVPVAEIQGIVTE